MQYGPIVDIDLKLPPRPPGYAFVEVRLNCTDFLYLEVCMDVQLAVLIYLLMSAHFIHLFSSLKLSNLSVWKPSGCGRCSLLSGWIWLWWLSFTSEWHLSHFPFTCYSYEFAFIFVCSFAASVFSHFLHFFVCLERLNLRMADGDIHHQLIAIAVIVGAAVVVVFPSILTIVVCVAY